MLAALRGSGTFAARSAGGNNMSDNYRFFSHKDCEYFPCHKTDHPEDFNCLFCYCPLYTLGDKCGGNFKYLDNGVKDCSECVSAHSRDAYDRIMSKWNEVSELAKRK